MGLKGTLRSIAAAQRRAEREARRKQRELERRQRELEKMQELERAQYEVETYENYIEVITSVHKDCGEEWDWEAIAETPEPTEPRRRSENEENARASLNAYEPSLMDKLLGRVDARRADLEAGIKRARERDELAYEDRMAQYEARHEEWRMNREIAQGILAGDAKAYMEAIRQVGPFSEIGDLGSHVSFAINDEDSSLIETTIHVNDHGEVIPRERRRLLKSGKLSVTDMPKTHFWALYQDYVCGAVLRVARELFALVPVDMVLATAMGELLNTQTGHLEEQPLLSVAMPRETMERLNFELLDPSDSMENFVHNIKFYKTRGFEPVEPISRSELER